MARSPVILITASSQAKGAEFGDASVSLSSCYPAAIVAAGGLPLVVPNLTDAGAVAELVRRTDGVLLTGGDDVQPSLYARRLPPEIRRTVVPDHSERDLLECQLIDQVLRLGKPLLAICRGHQILNVALGGTLFADIPQQVPGALNHRRSDQKDQPVHDVDLAPDSLLARISQATRLQVNSSHHQAVNRLAPAFHAVGRSTDGIVEAMEWKPKERVARSYLVSVQYHPERLFTRYPEHLALFLSFTRACRSRFNAKKA